MKQIIKAIWKSNEAPKDLQYLWLKYEDGEFRMYTMGQKGWEIVNKTNNAASGSAFNGEIKSNTPLFIEDWNTFIVNSGVTINSDWFKFLRDWYNNSDLDNNYIAVYEHNRGDAVCGYVKLKRSYNLGEDAVQISFLCDARAIPEDLQTIIIQPESSDWEDNFIVKVNYSNTSKTLVMNLPKENTTYSTISEMLAALRITDLQYKELLSGKYTFVKLYSQYNPYSKIYPIMMIDQLDESVCIGVDIYNYYTECWNCQFKSSDLRITYREI